MADFDIFLAGILIVTLRVNCCAAWPENEVLDQFLSYN